MRFLLTIQYLGTRYAGWQAQANAVAIQTIVEGALGKMYGERVRVEGASRTDSGVHAAAQRAHFDAAFEIPLRGMVLGLNDLLPGDIRIIAAERISDDFHCRFAAKGKTYTYRIWNAAVTDVFRAETHVHIATPLDVQAMSEAAAALAGTHDFRAFTVAEPEVSSTIRTVSAISVSAQEYSVQETAAQSSGATRYASLDARSMEIRCTADGFLRSMVRRIAGTLIEIGSGRCPVESMARNLEPTFAVARWTAPAKGLVLEEIRY